MKIFPGEHHPASGVKNFLRYVGPGLLVTVGFIDPGNWASNVAAGSQFGYRLLWMVTLSTFMLIVLQHNAAHLGIVTGKCLSESVQAEVKNPFLKRLVLYTAVGASVSTAMAEILGGGIALFMLFKLPVKIGSFLCAALALYFQFTNAYKKIEKVIIGFVSLIGLSFLVEVLMAGVKWNEAAAGWVVPSFPKASIMIIMSVLGAVVMPHNLFLHSEVIQSRQWNLEDEAVIRKQLKYEFGDTLLSMLIGWAINSAMILVAAATFYANGRTVTDLAQAGEVLKPLMGNAASVIFAIALLLAGVSSSITAGMAGGSIFAGIFAEPYDIRDSHSKAGVLLTMLPALAVIMFVSDPYRGLIYSQMLLGIQLPITIFAQIYLTSSKKVMGKYANSPGDKVLLWIIAVIVTALNLALIVGTV